MPRLRERPTEKAKKAFSGHVKEYLYKNESQLPELIDRVRMSKSTFYKRKEDPGTLSVAELRRFAQVCGWDARAVCEIVGIPIKESI